MNNRFFTQALAIAAASLLAWQANARPNIPYAGGKGSGTGSGRVLLPCQLGNSRAELDINNVRAMVLNGGDMWWNLTDGRYEVPKVTDPSAPRKHSMFAGAVWLGGVDQQNNLYVAQQTYRQGTPKDAGWWPGPLDANAQAEATKCAAFDFHSKINRQEVDAFKVTGYVDEESLSDDIRNWPGRGNPYLASTIGAFPLAPNAGLAPFKDVNGDGIYNPRDNDYPLILGDQAIWWVMNDVGGIKEPVSPPIGLELQVMGFAFTTSDLINNMTFYKQTLINRGTFKLQQTYLGQWVDPDLGNFNDDYVGCDVARGLGICYNGDNEDEGAAGYGLNPPAIGVDFFSGPASDLNDGLDNNRNGFIDEVGTDSLGNIVTEPIIMSNFMYYNNDFSDQGNPTASQHYYNYLRSIWKNGNNVTYGGDGFTLPVGGSPAKYNFMFPSSSDPKGYGYQTSPDPNASPGKPFVASIPTQANTPLKCAWSERNTCGGATASNPPADRRFLLSAGPFTLDPGAQRPIDLTIGVVWARPSTGQAYDPASNSGQILVADQTAQELFDNNFEVLKGAPAPDLSISELDQELIVTIDPIIDLSSRTINVENDIVKDISLETFNVDPFYRFEGYVVYQLRDAKVSQSDLRDTELAKPVSQSDVVNDLGTLVNTEFDPELSVYIPSIQIKGDNQGIKHTIRVTRDLFAKGNPRLVNFKKYYYAVVSYSSSAFRGEVGGNIVTPKYRQYREGIENYKVYEAIPHKIAAENGLSVNATSNQLLPITRLYGVGNGFHILEIPDSVEQRVVAQRSVKNLLYEADHSPIAIKVYDPKRVAAADFNLKLSSRLEYQRNSSATQPGNALPQEGDTIYATLPFSASLISLQSFAPPGVTIGSEEQITNIPQVPGIAVVKRVVSTGVAVDKPGFDKVVLDVEMLNDQAGGTFFLTYEEYNMVGDPAEPIYQSYRRIYSPFEVRRNGNVTMSARTTEFVRSDFWRLNITPAGSGQSSTIFSDRTLSEFNEQLVPEYGLAIQLRGATDPGYLPQNNRPNNVLDASEEFETSNKWFKGIPTESVAWLAAEGSSQVTTFDPGSAYTRVLGGAWAPYKAVAPVGASEVGAAYRIPSNPSRVNNLPNIDIVFTKDQSKWTRVPVVQVQRIESCKTGDPYGIALPTLYQRFLLSQRGSVDKNGNPIGDGSKGMGWFPGYAIDLDRGVRVNMMFAEDRGQYKSTYPTESDSVKGNDLIWDPSSSAKGNRNYIYCMTSVYDEGESIRQSFQSLIDQHIGTGCLASSSITIFANAIKDQVYNQVTWVGNIRLTAGSSKLASDARVRLRVNREYISYSGNPSAPALNGNDNPEYAFTTNGLQVTAGNVQAASSALDLIRVVPNPYYAYSDYEQNQIENTVKITNLPPVCKVNIYTINGSIVQTFYKNDATRTWLDWNLKNRDNLPISSGVYIIHVDAGNLGEKVVKWFGVMRPLDLETF